MSSDSGKVAILWEGKHLGVRGSICWHTSPWQLNFWLRLLPQYDRLICCHQLLTWLWANHFYQLQYPVNGSQDYMFLLHFFMLYQNYLSFIEVFTYNFYSSQWILVCLPSYAAITVVSFFKKKYQFNRTPFSHLQLTPLHPSSQSNQLSNFVMIALPFLDISFNRFI